MQTDRTTVGVRGRATRTHQQVKEIEAKFLAAWATISLMREFPLGEDLAATLIGDKVDAAADAAKQALDDAGRRSRRTSAGRARLARIEEVRTLLNNPKASIDDTNQRQMLKKVEELSNRHHRHAVLDGGGIRGAGLAVGMWSGFADAMHFDYMGPVADVRSEAQYH